MEIISCGMVGTELLSKRYEIVDPPVLRRSLSVHLLSKILVNLSNPCMLSVSPYHLQLDILRDGEAPRRICTLLLQLCTPIGSDPNVGIGGTVPCVFFAFGVSFILVWGLPSEKWFDSFHRFEAGASMLSADSGLFTTISVVCVVEFSLGTCVYCDLSLFSKN